MIRRSSATDCCEVTSSSTHDALVTRRQCRRRYSLVRGVCMSLSAVCKNQHYQYSISNGALARHQPTDCCTRAFRFTMPVRPRAHCEKLTVRTPQPLFTAVYSKGTQLQTPQLIPTGRFSGERPSKSKVISLAAVHFVKIYCHALVPIYTGKGIKPLNSCCTNTH